MSELMLNVSATPSKKQLTAENFPTFPNINTAARIRTKTQAEGKSNWDTQQNPSINLAYKKTSAGNFTVKSSSLEKPRVLKPQEVTRISTVNNVKTNVNNEAREVLPIKQKKTFNNIASNESSRVRNKPNKSWNVNDVSKSNGTDAEISLAKEKTSVSIVRSQIDGKVAKGYTPSLFRANPPMPVVEHKDIKPITESVFSSEHVDDMPIHDYSKSNLKQNMGVDKVTTVQQLSLPVLMNGEDALIRSQTGSGKTLAYAIPIVESLHSIRPKIMRCGGVMALVIVPTRELALQTYECFVKLVKPFTWVVPGYLVGGEKRKAEKARLRRGITILIGTPGRLLDHVNHTKSLLLDRCRWLVLDEADLLLDMGYERDVAKLIEALDSQQRGEPITPNDDRFHPADADSADAPQLTVLETSAVMAGTGTGRRVHRQTVLLSATLTVAVERLAGLTLRNPKFVDAAVAPGNESGKKIKKGGLPNDIGILTNLELVEKDLVIPESLKQWYMLTPAKLRLVALSAFVVWKCRNSNERKMLVFMATQDMVDYHTELFSSILCTRHATCLTAADDNESDLEDEFGLLANKDDTEKDDDATLVDIDVIKLHGSMSQKERTEVFRQFRAATSGVLLCTDVAARGLDLPHVDWIVQYTAPATARDYVHRVGRAARAGSAGNALIILAPSEAHFVEQLQQRRVCIRSMTVERTLKELVPCMARDRPALLRRKVVAMEEAATMLQARYEDAVQARRELHDAACRAYVSWVRFYSSYPLEARKTFDFRSLHLGHYAKSYALRDPPTAIAGVGKRQWLDRQRKSGPGGVGRRDRVPRGTRVKQDGTHLRGSDGSQGARPRPSRDGEPNYRPDLIRTAQKRERDLITSEFGSGLSSKRNRQN